MLQAHARRHRLPIDSLSFSFTVLDEAPRLEGSHPSQPALKIDGADDAEEAPRRPPPEEGVLVEGLYLCYL